MTPCSCCGHVCTLCVCVQDVAGAWQDRVKEKFADGSHDFVTQHLQEQLERVRKALPALKYCRGEPFKDEHWGSLLQGKLQLPKGLRLESLTVGHFLSRLDVLAEPGTLTFVKHLQVSLTHTAGPGHNT